MSTIETTDTTEARPRPLTEHLRRSLRARTRLAETLSDQLAIERLETTEAVVKAEVRSTKILGLRAAMRGLRRGLFRAQKRAERMKCELAMWRHVGTPAQREQVNDAMKAMGTGLSAEAAAKRVTTAKRVMPTVAPLFLLLLLGCGADPFGASISGEYLLRSVNAVTLPTLIGELKQDPTHETIEITGGWLRFDEVGGFERSTTFLTTTRTCVSFTCTTVETFDTDLETGPVSVGASFGVLFINGYQAEEDGDRLVLNVLSDVGTLLRFEYVR